MLCYHTGPEWIWERWQWRGTPHSPKLQHYWNFSIRLFCVISRKLVWWGVTPLQKCSPCFCCPNRLAKRFIVIIVYIYIYIYISLNRKSEFIRNLSYWPEVFRGFNLEFIFYALCPKKSDRVQFCQLFCWWLMDKKWIYDFLKVINMVQIQISSLGIWNLISDLISISSRYLSAFSFTFSCFSFLLSSYTVVYTDCIPSWQ